MKANPQDDRAAAQLTIAIVGYGLGLEVNEIAGPTRGSAKSAFARQVAMYLAHVAFEMSLNRVAIAFERDRSTVGHACHLIEDRRDAIAFDDWIESLESLLREAFGARQREAA